MLKKSVVNPPERQYKMTKYKVSYYENWIKKEICTLNCKKLEKKWVSWYIVSH